MKRIIALLLVLVTSIMSQAQLPNWLPTNGLKVWYPFNGNANDESGNGHHGTVYSATLTTDRFGIANTAYSFNGFNNYITLPTNSGDISGTNNFSISYWVNQSFNINTQSVFNHWASFGNPNGLPLGFITDIYNGNVTSAYTVDSMVGSFTLITVHEWHHVVIIYDGRQSININRQTLYIDGVLEELDSACFHCSPNIPPSLGTNGNWTLIGARNDNFSNLQNFFNGKIDDIGIWNRSLTSCEVNQLYRSSIISINSQPVNQVLETEHQAVFSVNTSDSCISYQWQQNCGSGFTNLVNSSVVSGATDDSLVLKPITPSMNNCQYRCIISSCLFCSDTSDIASLTVTIGIDEQECQGFRIFPNPFSDELNLSHDCNNLSEISIYDILSRKIISRNYMNSISMDTKQLAGGIYFYEMSNKNGILRKGKLIKN